MRLESSLNPKLLKFMVKQVGKQRLRGPLSTVVSSLRGSCRQGQGVVQVEDHLLRHVTPALPHQRLSSLRGQGVVALEDHSLRHVTGSPPHIQVLNLWGRAWTPCGEPTTRR